MSLVKADLQSALQSSLESYPASAAAAAQSWADAIANHVAAGVSPAPHNAHPLSASIDAGKSVLVAAITSAFQAGNASGSASMAAGAIVLFYQGLLFLGITAGSVTAVSGAAALGPALTAAFNDNTSQSATMAQAAARFADAIHACAQTIIVTHIPHAYVVGPLT